MKVQANKFCSFLEKATLKGSIPTSVLNFGETGVTVKIQAANVIFVKAFLDKKIFSGYEAIGDIGIKNNAVLLSLLKRYKIKDIKLEVEANKLVIASDTGSTFYVLCDKDMADNHIDKELELDQLDGGFELAIEKFSSIKEGAGTIKASEINVEIKDKHLTLLVENETGDKVTEELSVDYKDCKAKYGDFLQKIIDVASGVVNIALANDYPIQFKEKTEDFLIKYIVAPLTENQ